MRNKFRITNVDIERGSGNYAGITDSNPFKYTDVQKHRVCTIDTPLKFVSLFMRSLGNRTEKPLLFSTRLS